MKVRLDTYSALMILVMAVSVACAIDVACREKPSAGTSSSVREVEAEVARSARAAFIEKIYSPVEQLRSEPQSALLKLAEISRRYPGEPHGYFLKGEIQHRLGADAEAAESFAAAVRANPDYVDRHSPQSRRAEIEQFLAESGGTGGHGGIAIRYLRSRLAGGCE